MRWSAQSVHTWITVGMTPQRRQTEGPAMDQLTHIGLDVHKETIAVAVLRPGDGGCPNGVLRTRALGALERCCPASGLDHQDR
jgi:hypothetical protein